MPVSSSNLDLSQMVQKEDLLSTLKLWEVQEVDNQERYGIVKTRFESASFEAETVIKKIVGLATTIAGCNVREKLRRLSDPCFEMRWAHYVLAISSCCLNPGAEANPVSKRARNRMYESVCKLLFSAFSELQSKTPFYFATLLSSATTLPPTEQVASTQDREEAAAVDIGSSTDGVGVFADGRSQKKKVRRRSHQQVAISKMRTKRREERRQAAADKPHRNGTNARTTQAKKTSRPSVQEQVAQIMGAKPNQPQNSSQCNTTGTTKPLKPQRSSRGNPSAQISLPRLELSLFEDGFTQVAGVTTESLKVWLGAKNVVKHVGAWKEQVSGNAHSRLGMELWLTDEDFPWTGCAKAVAEVAGKLVAGTVGLKQITPEPLQLYARFTASMFSEEQNVPLGPKLPKETSTEGRLQICARAVLTAQHELHSEPHGFYANMLKN